jgi:hypothetical protein
LRYAKSIASLSTIIESQQVFKEQSIPFRSSEEIMDENSDPILVEMFKRVSIRSRELSLWCSKEQYLVSIMAVRDDWKTNAKVNAL